MQVRKTLDRSEYVDNYIWHQRQGYQGPDTVGQPQRAGAVDKSVEQDSEPGET